MNDLPDRYAIIPLEPGPVPAEAIAIGNIEQVLEYIPQSVAREKAEAELARARVTADAIKTAQAGSRRVLVSAFADGIDRLARRLDAFEEEREEQARRDAEEAERREAERIAAHLDAMPDPDDPDTWDPHQGGGLVPIAASHPEDKEQLAAFEDQGDLPNELLEKAPPSSGTAPTIGFTDARRTRARPYKTAPHSYPQPVAVSLNED
jgi:hypothetical protein